MRKIITPYIVLCVVFTYVSNFSFAADPIPTPADLAFAAEQAYCATQSSVCGTAPKDFTALLDFVREMTNSIKTIGTEWNYLGQYVNPNRFIWNNFSPPTQWVIGKVMRNIGQKIKFGFASTAIFSSPVNVAGLKDMLWWVVLLSKNQVFLRDNKLVEQMESQVNDKKYELGLWGWWHEQIIPENIVVIQAVIQKYIAAWLLTWWSIVAGVSYNNVTSLLTQTLSAAKSFLYFGSTDQFTTISRGGADQGIFIRFNDLAINNLQRTYKCARWPNYICSSESKKIKEKLTAIWKSVKLLSPETKKTFNDAVTRLWQIFSPSLQDDIYKARQDELLKSMYGTKKLSKWTLADSLKKSWDTVKKSWTEVGQQVSDAVSDVSSFRTFPKTLDDTVKSAPILPIPSIETATTTNITTIIDSYIYDVFASQQAASDSVAMTEVQDVTPAFAVLGQQLSVIKNDILGGKDKNNSLIGSLWVACELQCGRWWLCR